MVKTLGKGTGPTFAPPLDAWPDAGVYQLWIELRRPIEVCVGARGVIHFAQGLYIYTGRAARGLRARVLRHVHGAQRLHWHIDYLLSQRGARVEKVVLAATDPAEECRVNQGAGERGGMAVPGFGASDCRNGCPGHLWRVELPRPPGERGGPLHSRSRDCTGKHFGTGRQEGLY